MKDLSKQLFFCYSWDDLNEVQKVANAIMHELSCSVSFYKGEETTSDIEDVVFPLIEAADVILVFISDTAKNSDYVKQCALHAARLNKRILPIIVGKTSLFASMPEELKFRAKAIDYKDENQRAKLFGQLKATLGVNVEGGDHFGTLVHISTDVNAKVMRYGNELCVALVGKDNCVRLTKGTHKLDFSNMGNSSESFSISYDVKNNEGEQFLVVNFRKEIEKIAKQKQAEIDKEKRTQSLKKILGRLAILAIIGGVIYYFSSSSNDAKEKAESVLVENKVAEKPEMSEIEIDARIIAFVTDMFNESKYYENAFLESHCTPRLLKRLRDEYDYDITDGVAYAGWLFRTNAQDIKYAIEEDEKNVTRIINVTPQGDGWYLYEFHDMGWLGKNQLHATIKNDVVWIDDLQKVYSETDDYHKVQEEEGRAALKLFHTTDGNHVLQGLVAIPNEEGLFSCEKVVIRFNHNNEKICDCYYSGFGYFDKNVELSGIWLDNGYRFYNDTITIDLSLRDFDMVGRIKYNDNSYEVSIHQFKEVNDTAEFNTQNRIIDYRGNIGSYPITMKLAYNAESGSYYYNKRSENIFTLKPVLYECNNESDQYHVILDEFAPDGTNSGRFDGYIDHFYGRFSGTFTNSKNQSFDFILETESKQ